MKFRIRVFILLAFVVIVICTYMTIIRPDFNDDSENVDNVYVDIPDTRFDEWDLGPDPKWVKAVRAGYNSKKSTISPNEGKPPGRRLTVSERVNKYINLYRPKWNYDLNATSPWSFGAKWVTSRQIVGTDATELGTVFISMFRMHLMAYWTIRRQTSSRSVKSQAG